MFIHHIDQYFFEKRLNNYIIIILSYNYLINIRNNYSLLLSFLIKSGITSKASPTTP